MQLKSRMLQLRWLFAHARFKNSASALSFSSSSFAAMRTPTAAEFMVLSHAHYTSTDMLHGQANQHECVSCLESELRKRLQLHRVAAFAAGMLLQDLFKASAYSSKLTARGRKEKCGGKNQETNSTCECHCHCAGVAPKSQHSCALPHDTLQAKQHNKLASRVGAQRTLQQNCQHIRTHL